MNDSILQANKIEHTQWNASNSRQDIIQAIDPLQIIALGTGEISIVGKRWPFNWAAGSHELTEWQKNICIKNTRNIFFRVTSYLIYFKDIYQHLDHEISNVKNW